MIAGDGLKPLDEHWRDAYRAARYARLLAESELNKRIRDIVLNLLVLTPDAKIGLPAMSSEGRLWMEKWTHVLEEMALRHGPYPAGFTREILHSEPFPDFTSTLAEKAARRMSALGLKSGEVLIKLGKRVHMEGLHREGAVRIQPASYFLGASHNGAVRDDELTIPLSFALTRNDVVRLVKNPEDVPTDVTDQRLDLTFTYPRDYWLYCLTTSIEPRLFVDFEADACVVIHDPSAFSARLKATARKHLSNPPARQGAAIYIDPLLPATPQVFVPFAKYFGYAYQREYRYCWLPRTTSPLEPQDFMIGPLTDIASLIEL